METGDKFYRVVVMPQDRGMQRVSKYFDLDIAQELAARYTKEGYSVKIYEVTMMESVKLL